MAVYDQFGRLMFGSETEPRDVLEYIVFEKHVAEIYGVWRMHDKIRAKGHVGPGDAVITTMKKPKPVSVSRETRTKEKGRKGRRVLSAEGISMGGSGLWGLEG